MRPRTRRLAVLGIAAAFAVTLATPALADPSTDPSSAPGGGERAAKVCARLPQIEARADKVLARLQAGEDTPGSVAFTKKRAERARANGNTDLATALDSRAKARQDMIPVLQKKKAGLPKAKEWCAAHGNGK
ncbi:hypothetical protein GCM10009557_92120 [Virgisporangium ochraceum]|uniref:Secreted protein n=1 Tax=Virgisporangium ochraceum TaxID=65505 RepID=A0A8J3ZNL3_9ACTN|nr:hypothetical protein [Virgisporangium ochraceum]GIJ67534.1 hypothetical protein Voc01_024510 [Virgisporangium ochraceum]